VLCEVGGRTWGCWAEQHFSRPPVSPVATKKKKRKKERKEKKKKKKDGAMGDITK
jgi:hypothetical protein